MHAFLGHLFLLTAPIIANKYKNNLNPTNSFRVRYKKNKEKYIQVDTFRSVTVDRSLIVTACRKRSHFFG